VPTLSLGTYEINRKEYRFGQFVDEKKERWQNNDMLPPSRTWKYKNPTWGCFYAKKK